MRYSIGMEVFESLRVLIGGFRFIRTGRDEIESAILMAGYPKLEAGFMKFFG